MTFTLGYAPEKFKLVVSPGSDFFSSLTRRDDSAWPVDSTLTIDFGNDIEWEATLNGATATWDVDQDDVDDVIESKPRKIRLWYVDGELRLLWAQGAMTVSG